MDQFGEVTVDVKATVFRPYTECIMEYTSLPQLVYDLQNRKDAFKNWYVQMNGKIYTVPDFVEWYVRKYLRFGDAKKYEKV